MARLQFNCLPTVIGSMPHTDPQQACEQVIHYLKDIPAWPQLPKRSFLENMCVQFSEGFPGVAVKEDKIYVDRSRNAYKSLETLYAAYLGNDVDKYPITRDYAAGLHEFLAQESLSPLAVKGQITGPVTWGLTVTDDSRRAVIYDDGLGDAVAKLLRLKAGWQEKKLSQVCKNTIIFVDEPYMSAYGSVGVSLSRERVISLLEEVFAGIGGVKGVHCCGNTDWSVLLATSVDIISFDAYNYAQSLSLYPTEIKEFIGKGKAVAWGIVPNNEASLAKETVSSLKDRLEEAMAPFTRNGGIRFPQFFAQGLITPSCGLGGMSSSDAAAQTLQMLAELSIELRRRYM